MAAADHRFIDRNQIQKDVDQRKRYFRDSTKGGWTFSTGEQGWPVLDCTAFGLMAALALAPLPGDHPLMQQVKKQLDAYFEGGLRQVSIPLQAPGTAFQEAVWDALRRIPYGVMRSYAEIAAAIGQPDAVRAVGGANGDNRIAIVIPCHRVVAADGDLTGYGGGLWRKEYLLALEQAQAFHLT